MLHECGYSIAWRDARNYFLYYQEHITSTIEIFILPVNRSDTLFEIKLVSVWNETTQFTESK